MKLKIFATILACILCLTSAYVTEIKRENNFWSYGYFNNSGLGSMSFNLCFSGVSRRTTVILIKDRDIPGINSIISSSISISETISGEASTALDVTWDDVGKQYVLRSSFFRNLYEDRVYCLRMSASDANALRTLKNIQITSATSQKTDAIVFSTVRFFTSFELYRLETEAALKATLATFDRETIRENSEFNLTVDFEITLAPGKIIPTLDDQAVVYLEFSNVFTNNVNISLKDISTTNPLQAALTKVPEYSELGNSITLTRFGETFVTQRKFRLVFERLRAGAFTQDNFSLTTRILWRNTNSVVSNHILNLSKRVSRYELSSVSLDHINKFPLLYTGSSWPLQLTFRINTEISSATAYISDNTGTLAFLTSTCDFSYNSNSNSKCSPVSDAEFRINEISLVSNEVFTIRVWAYVKNIQNNPSPSVSVYIRGANNGANITDSFSASRSFVIKEFNDNVQDNISSGNPCTGRNNELNCHTNLYANENTGNFVLANANTTGEVDLDNDAFARTLYDSRNNNLRLRFRYDYTGTTFSNSYISQSFAGDWTKVNNGNNKYSDADFALGQHRIFYPLDYISPASNNLACKLSWGSNFSSEDDNSYESPFSPANNPSVAVGNTQDENNKFYNIITPTVGTNSLDFNNFAADNSRLLTGVFRNLVINKTCTSVGSYFTCDYDNNNNISRTVIHDLEITTNCLRYNNQMTFRSIYANYDLMHVFSVKDKNEFIRANRFISLLPQPGVFTLTNTFQDPNFSISNQADIIRNTYFSGGLTSEAICLITLVFNNNTLIPGRESYELHGFLNNFDIIDFEDLTSYPVGNFNVAASRNEFIGNKTNKHARNRSLQNFQMDSASNSILDFYNNSDYAYYLGNHMKFTISAPQYSANEILVPVKCKVDTAPEKFENSNSSKNINFAFSELVYTEASNLGFSLKYAYDDDLTFVTKKQVYINHGNNIVRTQAQWADFIYNNNTKLRFTQSSGQVLGINYPENQIRYVSLASKSGFAIENRIENFGGNAIEANLYRQILVENNNFTLNGKTYSNLLLNYFIQAQLNGFGFRSNDEYQISFRGVPLTIHNDSPAKNDDIALYAGSASSLTSSDDFLITNYDGSNYLVNASSKVTIENDVSILKQISYVNSNIKGGNGGASLCGFIKLEVPANVFSFEVTSPNFVSRSIAEIRGQGITKSPSNATFNFKVDVSGQDYLIYFCNIDVNQSNKFRVTRVVYYFKDASSQYRVYNFENKVVSQDIPADNVFTSGRIQSYDYINTKNTYTELNLRVKLDHDVFRNMRLVIEANIADTLIDANYTPICEPTFNNDPDHPHNVIWETCKVEYTTNSNKITITTYNNIIIYETLLSEFYVNIRQVKAPLFNTSNFLIRARFNEDNSTELFPETNSVPITPLVRTEVDTANPFDVSAFMEFNSIKPQFPELPTLMEFTINLAATNTDLQNYLTTSKILELNELRIYFNHKYFGPVPNKIICYINQVIVENCTSEIELIFIRTTLPKNALITVGIYGYPAPQKATISSAAALIMVSVNDRRTFSRSTWLHGVVHLKTDFDITAWGSAHSNAANLRIFQQRFSDASPSTVSDVTLKVGVDNLLGVYPHQNNFVVPELKDGKIFFRLPDELDLSADSNVSIIGRKFVLGNSADSTVDRIEETTLNLINVVKFGNLIYGVIDTNYAINTYFREFEIKFTRVINANTQTRLGLFEIFLSGTNYYLETFPMLQTSSTYDALTPNYYFIQNYRGVNQVYSSEKYWFDVVYDASLKPGVYGTIKVNVKGSGLPNAFTTISIPASNSKIITLEGQTADLDGRFNLEGTLNAGISCGAYAGKYIVKIASSNADMFHNVPNVIYNVVTIPEKNTVVFYSSPDQEYNSVNDLISLGRGGFTYFWIKPFEINSEAFTVTFAIREKTNTTVTPPSSVTVPVKTSEPVVARFNSPDAAVSTQQTYNIIITNNECFTSKIEFIKFNPNIVIEAFTDLDIQFNQFIYQNAEYQPIRQSKLNYNSIRFLVNADQANVLPVPSNLYCALYCIDRDPISDSILATLPHPENNWYENYFVKQIKGRETFDMTFDNLVRDQEYSLKCLIESSQADQTKRSAVSKSFSTLQNLKLKPVETPVIKCVDLEVRDYLEGFEKNATNIIQETFFENFEINGCILAVDSKGNFVQGYETTKYDCFDTKAVVNPEPEPDDSFSEDSETSEVTETPVEVTTSASADTGLRYLGQRKSRNSKEKAIIRPKSGSRLRNLLNDRYLQEQANTTNTTDSTNTTDDDDVVVSPSVKKYHRICLAQSPKCPNVFGVAQERNLDDILTTLLTDPIVKKRSLQVNSTTADITVLDSPFRNQLTDAANDNFIGWTIRDITTTFDLARQNIRVSYTSDFKVYENAQRKNSTSFNVTFNSTDVDAVTCWYLINNQNNPEFSYTRKEITRCEPSNIFCGSRDGIVLPHTQTIELTLDVLQNKEYSLWLTCRENAYVSRTFTTPSRAMRLTGYYHKQIVPALQVVTECKLGHPEFPACCPSRNPHEDDETVCWTNFLSSSILMLAAVLAILF